MQQLTGHKAFRKEIFNITADGFNDLALRIFQFQFEQNPFYREYCHAVNVDATAVKDVKQIPFLPIQFFKSREIKTTLFEPEMIFESSGTTGSVNSKHFIKEIGIYEESFINYFESSYGDSSNYCILGLLPSYLERKHSSLVWMVNALINKSKYPESGFHLYDHETLKNILVQNEKDAKPTLLIGVTYALLDFFEKFQLHLKHTFIMETGGMKGRKAEMTRTAVHQFLKKQANVDHIHSEYGMTELLSQAYAKKNGIFHCPAWMKVVLRKEDDPFDIIFPGTITREAASGVINIFDLANVYSCSFIATDDIGKLYNNGSFEVMGRLDNSDIRGCSLMSI